ncbi:MAG TPA: hypothetical protein VMF53_06730 [Alphaproteobacteria bacterium]|nr:hypothetical protein [Alphaproteobacteria bacterium]
MPIAGGRSGTRENDLPAPPITPEVDLRNFPFTPVYRARLFGSSFTAHASDAEWRAGVTLFLRAWDQSPAGSLPDSDVELARLADLGRDVASWQTIREIALRGWLRHSDGRLYHPVVTEIVLEAWARRAAARKKGIAGAARRWGSSAGNSRGTGPAIAQPMPGDGKGREAKGSENPEGRASTRATRLPANFEMPPEWIRAAQDALARHGLRELDNVALVAEKFTNYWHAKAGNAAAKIDWRKTWINWVLGEQRQAAPGHARLGIAETAFKAGRA